MVKILHVNLKPMGEGEAQFRFFWDNPNDYRERTLSQAEIAQLNRRAETDYYTSIPVPHAQTGQILYNWLDGSDRYFQSALDECKLMSIVLAIAASGRLANLPWELLHDGTKFLVERHPAIVPVRWVADRERLRVDNDPKNRFLNLLFMASSPHGVEPKLDFEAEEGQILLATERKRSLCLTVEESGNLQELGELVEDYEKGYFDVIHLTGHAAISFDKPYFLTETEFGDRKDSSAKDIARVLQFQYPKLIFLSGCRTGYSSDNAVPSMASELLKEGAKAVLSWGDRVGDENASAAAASFYQFLSTGETVSEALARTYQTLLNFQGEQSVSKDDGGGSGDPAGIRVAARQWHLLRFKALIEVALNLADGNPRLLEWLNDEVLSTEDASVRLTQLSASSSDWKGKIIWDELYQQIDPPFEKILSLCLVYSIPVPIAALSAVCDRRSQFFEQFQRAIELGLIEVSPDRDKRDRVYRVGRILPRIIPSIRLPQEPKVYSLYRKAHEKLHQLWGNKNNRSSEKWREIFRLLFADLDNATRFRQGFSVMLSVQYNPSADRALESELRELAVT